jgi:hypothetical protein
MELFRLNIIEIQILNTAHEILFRKSPYKC